VRAKKTGLAAGSEKVLHNGENNGGGGPRQYGRKRSPPRNLSGVADRGVGGLEHRGLGAAAGS